MSDTEQPLQTDIPDETAYDWLTLDDGEEILWAAEPHFYSIVPALIFGVPLMLVLMFIAEMNGVAYAALHTVGGLFLVSRIGHAWGMHEAQGRWHAARAAGVAGTWLALLGACGLLVYNVLTIRY